MIRTPKELKENSTCMTVEPLGITVYFLTTKEGWALIGEDPRDCLGFVSAYKNRRVVGLPVKYDEYTVWHEAHHLARFLNAECGILTDASDHEADCYLQESLVRQIKKQVYGRKI
tara:strand:+ start:160 stop:504 length:345 start_codon:yes stop_codon:yes gene_type:complete